jgi:hypothetical protein
MSGHTKGPWIANQENGPFNSNSAYTHNWNVLPLGLVDGEEGFGLLNEHDARLIAAAPELLEALKDALETLDNYSDVVDGTDGQPAPNRAMSAILRIESAIAKAEGK